MVAEAAAKRTGPVDRLADRLVRDVPAEDPSWLLAALFPTRQLAVYVARLATCLSERLERTVCCIDGDWRRQDLTKELGLADEPGLGDYLTGRDDAVPFRAVRRGKLEVIPGGMAPSDSARLTPHAVRDCVRRLPPAAPRLIMTSVDHDPVTRGLYASTEAGYLLLPRSKTRIDDAARAFHTLARYHARILGVIFF